MREVGSFEAKNRLSELLSLAEAGEEIAITRRGMVVARLVPPKPAHDPAEALAAVERIRAMRKELNLGPFDWDEWRAYRDEGRR